MDIPKVSVIVPIYNVEKYLEKCVNSILNQTLKEIEVILVDDGSPDECPQLCDRFATTDRRIQVIHKRNEGLGFARNSGLELARGEYVYFVDSDDYLCLNALEILYSAAKKENADLCFGGIISEDDNGKQNRNTPIYAGKVFKQPEINRIVLAGMLGSEPEKKIDISLRMSAWQGIYRRKWITDNKLKFPSERQFISEDIIFHLNALPKADTLMYIEECVYCHIVDNPNSLTHKYNPERYKKDVVLYLEEVRLIEQLPENEKMKVNAQRTFLGNTRVCLKQIVNKSKKEGRKFALHEISQIASDSTMKDVLSQYPYWKNPWKQALVSFLIKYKMISLIYILTKRFNSRNDA